MIEKTVKIGGKDVKFRSSATIPRLYRIKFKRDIFQDLSKLEKSYKSKNTDFEIDDLEIFENVLTSWPTMRITRFLKRLKNGSMSLKCFLSMRCCLKF